MTLPWAPPRLWTKPGQEALWNALISLAGQEVALAPGTQVVFVPAEAPEPRGRYAAVDMAGGRRLVLRFEAFPFREMFDVDLPVESLPDLPPELEDALVEGMTATILGALPGDDAEGLRITVDTLADLTGNADLSGWVWFSVSLEGAAPEAVRFTAGCERSAVLEMLSERAVRRQPAMNELKNQITAPADFTLGALRLGLGELQSLGEGAIVVMPVVSNPERWLLRAEGMTYGFDLTGSDFECTSVNAADYHACRADNPNGGAAMATDPSDTEQPDAPKPRLDVVIDFDLKRISVPLDELESWQAGSVVALDPPARDGTVEVVIRANGTVIGSGDIVRIDERLAVRITRLAFES